MTTVRIGKSGIYASGHTDRELCIALAAHVQTAGAILDRLGVARSIRLDPSEGVYELEFVQPETDRRICEAVLDALTLQLVDLADDYPLRLRLIVDPA